MVCYRAVPAREPEPRGYGARGERLGLVKQAVDLHSQHVVLVAALVHHVLREMLSPYEPRVPTPRIVAQNCTLTG